MPSQSHTPSPKELARRRQYLRDRRRYNFYKTAWRSLAVLGMAAGSVWLATSPIWLIRSADQIVVSNNQLLSDESVQVLLPLPYPQSLLKVKTDGLAEALTQHAPIEGATVTRRLLPPGLQVKVRERIPVAATVPDTNQPVKTVPDRPQPFQVPGLMDADGYWMPRDSFSDLGVAVSPPDITVKGMRASYQDSWRSMYESIRRSPVKVTGIDWTRPNNVVLYSELGKVHIGAYGRSFEAQLAALDQMRSLSVEVNPEKVAFIDLQDPEHPVVEILQATSEPTALP